MKKMLFIGLVGLILSLSFIKPGMATGEFTEVPVNLLEVYCSSTAWGDYDNDGDLDILLAGRTLDGTSYSKIYRNDGNDMFIDINAELVGVYDSSVAWGDYDNDGDLDILLTGQAETEAISKIYRNDGDEVFVDIYAELVGVYDSSVAWGDYDNDGDLDILLTGMGTSTAISKIYSNDGNGLFTDINAELPGIQDASVAWGDYDNDGDLDILLPSITAGVNSLIDRIYRNDGPVGPNGQWQFTDISFGSLGVQQSSTAWGDYDNDGDLDILLAGRTFGGIPYSKIYRNDGNSMFTDINVELVSIDWGDLAWGDYDSDGDLDIVLVGLPVFCYFKVYRNDGNDVFTDINSELPGTFLGSVDWGDYDNDGDLDVLLTGRTGSCGFTLISKIYRNNLGSNTFASNTVPNAPSGLQASVSGDDVTLSWQKATDNETSQDGLYYNIFVGTSQYGVDTLSPMAQVPEGFRRISAIGSQNENTSWVIYGLADGTYYWGVQAVDTAFAGSPFATGSFIIEASYTISGMISLNSSGLEGVILEDGSGNYLATTDATGAYSFSKDAGWSEMVIPYKQFFSFSPSNRQYNNLSANQEDQNYAATLNSYTVSGEVTLNGQGLENVDIKDSQGYLLAVTGANGYYEFTKEHGWTETVVPYKTGYSFTPQSRSYNLTANQENQDYAAVLDVFTISGTVYGPSGFLVGVEIKDENGAVLATTNTNGVYSFERPYGWSGTTVAFMAGYVFVPVNRSYNNLSMGYLFETFEGVPVSCTISGIVKDNNGQVIQGATLTATGTAGTVNVPINNGSYSYTASYGSTAILTPSAIGYDFEPVSKTFANIATNQSQNFIGTFKTFIISGAVSGLSVPYNVAITAQGTGNYLGQNFTATVAPDGSYSTGKVIPYGWAGYLTAQSPAYNLIANQPVYNGQAVTEDVTQDYTASLKMFTISGNISGILSPNNPYNITVAATNTNNPNYGVYQSFLNIDATSGSYSISIPYGWKGSLSATSVAYNISPASIFIPPVNSSATGNFTATLKTFSISGDILEIVPGASYPVTITAECTNASAPLYVTVSNIDASSGHYNFTLPYGWEGELIAQSPAYELKEYPEGTFKPPVKSNQEQDYMVLKLKEYTVTGEIEFDILHNNTYPITITATCSNPLAPWYKDVIADAAGGHYSMLLPYGWEGALVPESAAYILIEDPTVTFTSPVTSNQAQNYLAKINMFAISGTVYLDGAGNKPIEGVTLRAKGTGNWASYTANELTNIEGDYTIDVPYGFSGYVVPSKTGYEFTPVSRSYDDVTANIDGHHYVGMNISSHR